MIERLLRAVFPNQDIEHEGSLYLRRWLLTPSVLGWRLMLHKIARPDRDRVLHDHPWDFVTLCLRGGYNEVVLAPDGGCRREPLLPGGIRFRSFRHTHRIEGIIGAFAWTLVLHGPRQHVWGFWDTMSTPPTFTESAAYFREGYDRARPMARHLGASA